MIAIACQHEKKHVHGKTKSGATRYKCATCGKTFTESTGGLDGMRIGLDRAAKIIELLCEGISVRAVSRVTDTHIQTITDLLVMVGERCEAYMAEHIRGVHVDEVQVDEIWQFVFCKKATAKQMKYVGGCGDSWCFTAIERHTKLLVTWHMGRRTEADTDAFVRKLDAATSGHYHVSTDGFKSYPTTIRRHLGDRVDHGVMQKIYGTNVYTD
ncbi:MAG TPA: hypothetical protein PJ982_04500, partial [Lacipirellulaceae bacterium]|nr:hypothetical protein [Lacipirellulaceae bacterium]